MLALLPTFMRPLSLATAALLIACAPSAQRVSPTGTVEPPPTSCSQMTPTDTTVYDTTQVSERPTLRTWVLPHYPDELRLAGFQGQVVVGVTVNTDGTVDKKSLKLIQPSRTALDREAIRFVRYSSYWPACLNGTPVRVRLAVPIDFKLKP